MKTGTKLYDATFVTQDEASKAAIENDLSRAIEKIVEKFDTYNEQYVIRITVEKLSGTVG